MSNFEINNFPNIYFNEVYSLSKFLNNNFIQKLICSFHDYDNLYLVTKFYDGGIGGNLGHIWNETQIQFLSACLIQIFKSLRKEKLIHRDIHYWNLMLDEKRYIILIDFHMAIQYDNKNDSKENSIVSPSFCAPEIINGLSYDYNSDYYRLGVMIYRNLLGQYPNVIRDKNNLTDVSINYDISKNFSYPCIDFINKLMISDKKNRIGFSNIDELKNHDFFKNFNWNELNSWKMKSPFKRKKRKKRNLCKIFKNITKRIFLNNKFYKNKTFRNIFLTYNKINKNMIDKIYVSLKYKKLNREK